MKKTLKNYAFIDSQNVNLGTKKLGWKLDWKKFRVYLKEQYGVETAYLFLGFIEEQQEMYDALQKQGYNLIFKETKKQLDGTIKGNCDAEMVLQAMIDKDNYKKAVVVSGDGDFACLVKYLDQSHKLRTVLVPNSREYSSLLRKSAPTSITGMNHLKMRLKYYTHHAKKKLALAV